MTPGIPALPGRHWWQPPTNLLVFFLLTTLGFLVGLVWLGWRSLQQDEDLVEKRVQERLESATNIVAAELRQNLAELERRVERLSGLSPPSLAETSTAWSPPLNDDVVLVGIDASTVEVSPPGRLLYYPTLPAADEPLLRVPRGEVPRPEDPRALEYYRVLAQSEDARVRADALLGLARTEVWLGRADAALAVYAQMQSLDVLVAGRPAELLARVFRCGLLADLGRKADLVRDLSGLHRDLHGGRWRLTRAAYEHYAGEVRQIADRIGLKLDPALPNVEMRTLAAGVDAVWKQWQEQSSAADTSPGRMTRAWNGRPVFLVWRSTPDRLTLLAAGPRYLRDVLVEPLRAMLDREGVGFGLEDGEGHSVLTYGTSDHPTQSALRTTADTHLPWTLRVVSADGGQDRAQLSTRRQLVIGALVFLALFVTGGTYLSARAVVREIEAARLKSDFVAAVSHEFRTPLTLLRQFSDLLADDRVTNDQERRRCYAALQRGTRRLTRLVEDLLDFGRMEAGSRQYTFEPVDAKSWLGALVAEFQEEVRSRGYAVDVSWTGASVGVLTADREAITRALWNLLDNAVKYSPTCRTIWVVGVIEAASFTVHVRDRGLGVAAEEQRAIFRKFVRGSTGAQAAIKGTGLGLALVQQIVEAHGGTVRLESVVGEGSTFSIVLPVHVEVEGEEQSTWLAS